MALVVKNLPANAGDIRDLGSIPGWGRSPGEGNGNPLQYSCLENPMDREAWRATVHRVTGSDTTERLSTHIHDQACLPSIKTSQVRLGSKPCGSEPFSHHNRIRTCLTPHHYWNQICFLTTEIPFKNVQGAVGFIIYHFFQGF